jgi:hypothetical protein
MLFSQTTEFKKKRGIKIMIGEVSGTEDGQN